MTKEELQKNKWAHEKLSQSRAGVTVAYEAKDKWCKFTNR
jgi:hypothetical protein